MPAWLAVCLALSVLLFAGVVILGADRSYWYDEVYTLGYANIGRPIDWALLKSDVHPPTYALLIRAMAEVFGMGPHGFDLRLVNLPGLLAALYGFWLLREVFDRNRLALLAVMLLCNFYTLMLGLDLRSYALLLGFGWLAHAALLLEFAGRRPRHLLLMASCTVLWSLHFFGAAIGLSILAVSALYGIRSGMPRGWIAARIALGVVLFGLFVTWVFGISEVLARAGGNLWIRNEPAPLLNFLGWTGPAPLVVIVALVLRRQTENVPIPRIAPMILVPGLMVLCAAFVIAFHTPVLSSRNLTVLVPGFLMAIALFVPDRLFTKSMGFSDEEGPCPGRAGAIAIVVLCVIGLRFADSTTRNGQMIEWALRAATPPECVGAPVFVNRPDELDILAQRVYLGRVTREPVDLFEYVPGAVPPGCPVIGMGWHEFETLEPLGRLFSERGTEVRMELPPDPRLAAMGGGIAGYVVRRAE